MKKRIFLLILSVLLLTALTGCGGKAAEIPENLTFSGFDFGRVNSMDLLNLRTGRETQTIYPDQLAEVADFLRNVTGTHPEPGKDCDFPLCSVTLKADFDTVLTLTFGENGQLVCHGARYTLTSPGTEEMTAFFSRFDAGAQ